MFALIFSVICCIQAINGLIVTIPPTNVTVNIGAPATIPCVVTGVQIGEDIKWKLANGTILADKSQVTNSNKYRVDGTYNLTILNTVVTDSGAYICAAATQSLTGYLTVNAGHLAAYSSLLIAVLAGTAVSLVRSQ